MTNTVAPRILVTAGIGDFFVNDSFWSPGFKRQLREIYFATSQAQYIQELIRALPVYDHVELHTLKDYRFEHYRRLDFQSAEEVRAHYNDLPDGVVDYSIRFSWPTYTIFYGSDLLRFKLADVDKFNLPERYAVIQPASIHGRALDMLGWRMARRIQAQMGNAVLLYKGELQGRMQHYDKFLNLMNRTTLLESIEILKRGSMYFGVDSCLACLACQIFKPADLGIISHNHQYYENRKYYCAPYTDWKFVKERFESWPLPAKN